MAVDPSQITFLLSRMALFRGLSPSQVELISSGFDLMTLVKGERLYTEGDEAENFYIVFSGKVRKTYQLGDEIVSQGVFVEGDHFGEESLLTQSPRRYSITAIEPVRLLIMEPGKFLELVGNYTSVRRRLFYSIKSQQLARRRNVDWLGKDETVYLFSRKDRAFLFITLVPPVLLAWFGIFIIYGAAAWGLGGFTTLGEYLGTGIFVLAILWGIWDFIDWTNDYYIVTNERVIGLEKIIAFYDSRQEAPNDTILTVGVNTDLLGRILGYGDVRVKTYTGQILFRHIGQPEYMVAMVEDLISRFKREKRRTETEALERAIRVRLGLPVAPDAPEAARPQSIAPPPAQRGENPFRFLLDIFKIRIEEEGMVTYRRHWLLLVRKAWLPTLVLFLMVYVLYARFSYPLNILTPSSFLVFWFLVGLIPLVWWIYEYVDWRNDIYQVTEDNIVDVYKKPLGEVDKKTAPLENILSIHHEQTGLIRIILNYGDVVAMVGTARFTFDGVYNPAEVVQDIFLRMNARKRRLQETEAARERERVADWLAAYHRQMSDLRNLENLNNSDHNSV
jgi:uncharacterized membrane protein YdbT with pleckstrin-like domain